MVTGWEDDCVFVVAERRFAGVPAADGWRRGACADETLDGCVHCEVVAGRKDDCVHVVGVLRVQRRRVQQEAERGERKEQSEGACGGKFAVPALDSLERRAAGASVCDGGGWQRRGE